MSRAVIQYQQDLVVLAAQTFYPVHEPNRQTNHCPSNFFFALCSGKEGVSNFWSILAIINISNFWLRALPAASPVNLCLLNFPPTHFSFLKCIVLLGNACYAWYCALVCLVIRIHQLCRYQQVSSSIKLWVILSQTKVLSFLWKQH